MALFQSRFIIKEDYKSTYFEGGHHMKIQGICHAFMRRFFILFNLTKSYERPSKDRKTNTLSDLKAKLRIEGKVLPEKETIMLDDLTGYTKTKVKIQQVYMGTCAVDEIIEIYEPYYEGYYHGEKCLIIHEDYTPLHIGESYTFLLTDESVAVKQVIKYEDYKQNELKETDRLFYQIS